MRNLLLTAEFLGTAYHGTQVQRNGETITQVLQRAIEEAVGEKVNIKASSRLDRGVHAIGFCLGFTTNSAMPARGAVKAINHLLPPDVAVLSCREMPQDFHPRYSARGKTYRYLFYISEERRPLFEGRALHCRRPLDVAAMRAAAQCLLGAHDLGAFCASGCGAKDKIRTVKAIEIEQSEPGLVALSVTADGFLYNMVRIIAGTLLEVGEGKRRPESVEAALAARERSLAGKTAPPYGLYLTEVLY
jgi:tRNA pseudouridine38-40 synthase